MDNAGLHSGRVFGHRADPIHIARKIDNDSLAERFAGQAGACTAWMDRYFVFCRILHTGNHIVNLPWPNDRQRTDFIDARIARVKLQIEIVAEYIACQQAAQIFLNTYLFLIHR